MFDAQKLWKDRSGRRAKDLGRYLRYIFNGHLVVVLLFLISAAAFYYQEWVKGLSPDFPAELLMAVIMGILLTYSPVYNFLLDADRVFLLPLENKLSGYFFRSGIVSLIYQGYILLMVLAALMPLYVQVSRQGFHVFLPFFAALLVLKGWNLAVRWRVQYDVDRSVHFSDMAVRFFVNGAFAYLLFRQANLLYFAVIFIVLALYYWFFYSKSREKGLKWDVLIAEEEKRMASFYRLANLFTDVPKLKDAVRRRKWLDVFLDNISFSAENTFMYLFSRTFMRAGDYLGLFIRLTVIGSIAIYFLSFGWGQLLLAILFLYLTGFQLLPLWNHHQNKLWVDLYPVAEKNKEAAFFFLMVIVLSLQAVIFTALMLIKGQWTAGVISLLAGVGFIYYFVFIYSKKRVKG